MSEAFFPPANISRLYPYSVAEALNRDVLWEPSLAEFEDPEFFEKVQRDPEIHRLLDYRCQLIAAERWYLEPASDSKADRLLSNLITGLIKQIPFFQSARFLLARSFVRASTWARVRGEFRTVTMPGFGQNRWWCITELADVDKREFELQRNHEAERRDPERRRHWRWMLADKSQGHPVYKPIRLEDFIHHVYKREERGLGHGTGLADCLYFLDWFKQEAQRNGMQFLSRWSQGLLVYHLDTLARGAVTTGTADRRAADALELLRKIRSGNNVVINRDEKVDNIPTPEGGWSTAKDALQYWDEQASRLILGSVTNTGGGTNKGSLARAETEKDSMEALIQFDRGLLDETLTSSIVLRFVRKNWALIRSLGLGAASAPAFHSSGDIHADPKESVEMFSTIAEKMPGAAARIPAPEFFRRIGVTPAAADEGVETLADVLGRGAGGAAGGSGAFPGGAVAAEGSPPAPPPPDLKEAAEIIGLVVAGQLPAESAVALLSTVFGDQQARAMVMPAVRRLPSSVSTLGADAPSSPPDPSRGPLAEAGVP